MSLLVDQRAGLPVRLENRRESDAVVSVRVVSVSEAGRTSLDLSPIEVAGMSTVERSVLPNELALPVGSFEYSGGVAFTADASFSDGTYFPGDAVRLFFHPADGGWRI